MNENSPTGIVTFMFTDIEGSSRLWEQFPEAMNSTLARHDAILQQAVTSHSGYMVKTTGDGCLAAFEMVADALTAALTAQQALQAESWQGIQPHKLRVRIGIHTGQAERHAGDYFGPVLNRTARLMSAGHGGQILVSAATAELGRDILPAQTQLVDLGEHRLKDLTRKEHIFQLVHPALQSEFPPLKSLDASPNNLPIQLTSFIGREKEIIEIQGLLADARLVTLTGPGGTGKTRLSQEVGSEELAAFPGGVWLIELASLSDSTQIVPTMAQVFGLQELLSKPLIELVVDYLRDKKILLLLDNCEHLIEACARLADDLLHQCAGLKLLASSREALGIAGEVAYRMPPLADSESIQLFADRARAASSNFKLTDNNHSAIAQICQRLDGIPLAIELAAARVKLLSPEQIVSRLNDRFRLLVGGSRTALPRQQTLRALIDWSYDLLSDDEKLLLQYASVFVGGWTLDALEAITEDPDTLDLLEQLINKSL
ncbi:MAG: adenylate/guanylate cyclase domain-containing protein, partial [Anaerolineales bacterium]